MFLDREPFCEPAQRVWTLAVEKELVASISALSISHAFFIIQKCASSEKAYEAIEALVEGFKIIETDSKIVKKALQARLPDFEDAIQYFSALKFRAQAIISRDPSGFREGKIPIMDCAQYLATR